jgi:CRISPR-associated protein Cas2
MSNWLVCYDITSTRRLQQVHRRVARLAHAVQRSVYYFEGDTPSLEHLLDLTRTLLDPATDDVRVYPILGIDRCKMTGSHIHQAVALTRRVWSVG